MVDGQTSCCCKAVYLALLSLALSCDFTGGFTQGFGSHAAYTILSGNKLYRLQQCLRESKVKITGEVIKFSLTESYKIIAEVDLFPEDVTFKDC